MLKLMFHLNCLEQGGAERVVSNLANQFAEEDYEIIIATEWQGRNEFAINPRIRRIHVGMQAADRQKGRLSQALLRIKYLRRLLRREAPDILIAFGQKANYRALTAGLGLKIPVIVSVRTDPKGHYDRPADKILIPLLYPTAAGFVFQTAGQRDFFPSGVRKKSRIILNPIHPKYIGAAHPGECRKEVVHSGRLVDFKNQSMLITAFIKVHERHPDYILKIYGDDSYDGTKETLEGMIAARQAADYVLLMGASDELERDMPGAACYAFTSDWEGLPNALVEAMVLGLPVVATDCPCGGPRTLITNDSNGLLIPVKDETALVDAICKLIENPDLAARLGEEARKLAGRVAPDSIAAGWREYILEIIKKQSAKKRSI